MHRRIGVDGDNISSIATAVLLIAAGPVTAVFFPRELPSASSPTDPQQASISFALSVRP